jgi:hypothetical protein
MSRTMDGKDLPAIEGEDRAGQYVFDAVRCGYVDVMEFGCRTRVDRILEAFGAEPPQDHAALFAAIYRTNAWCSSGSRSGPGSDGPGVSGLCELVARYSIASLVDVPCGDLAWLASLDLASISYTGIDIVPEIVEENIRRFNGSRMRFLVGDLTVDPIPQADLVLCRDGMVHMSNDMVVKALRNIARSDGHYLLCTTFPATHVNYDIRTGRWRPLNLRRAPFHLPPPLVEIDDSDFFPLVGKTLALWSIEQLSKLSWGPL